MIARRIFQSKILVFSLIFSFIFLLATEAAPRKANIDSDEEFKPVVRVKEGREENPAGQKERFERLIEEGKKLFQEEMDPEGAIKKFKEAESLAITRVQKADVYFYLSLAYYTTLEERGAEEFDEAIRKLIETDYYRELDKLLCPPKYIELFEGIKKEYGVLRIQSKPAGADVFLNDGNIPVGKTPLTIGAKAGSVKIRIKKGAKEKKEILKVIAGKETTSPILILKGGSGLLLALGGLALAGVAGAVVLSKGGAGEEGQGPGATTGSIQVNSSPQGARVYLDGTDTRETTNCILTNVSPGNHAIALVKEGYEDYERSVSVTGGQTTTINANLAKNTITVTSPTSSTNWLKGSSAEITWQTSGSSSFQGNVRKRAGLNPLSHSGRNSLSLFRRTALRARRSFRDSIGTKREVGNMSSAKAMEISSNISSKTQDAAKKFSSLANKGNTIKQRAKNIGIIKRNNRFGMINSTAAPGVSFNSSRHSAHVKKPLRKMKVLSITDVKIELYKGDSLVETIVSRTENDGTHTWTEVNPDLPDGTDYRIRISCATDSEIYGDSDEFKISKFVLKWGSEGTSDGQFDTPEGIATDSSGYVYVADTRNDRIQKFDSNGNFQTKWGIYGTGDGEFDLPGGIAVDSSGYVYVADTYNHRIQKFDSNGNFQTKWGSNGAGDGQFDYPEGIAVDSSGYVYVVDTDNNRIQKFSSSGGFVTMWGSFGTGDGQFDYPEGIAADSSGYVYVADTWSHRIQKFDSNGNFQTQWGSFGSGDGQFNVPQGLAVANSNDVYVADTGNHRIQKFQLISATLGLTRNNSKILDNNFIINKNSTQRFRNMESPLQNRLKEQIKQMNRKDKKSD